MKRKRPKPLNCPHCNTKPKYERMLDNHNRPWFELFCPAKGCEYGWCGADPKYAEAIRIWNHAVRDERKRLGEAVKAHAKAMKSGAPHHPAIMVSNGGHNPKWRL